MGGFSRGAIEGMTTRELRRGMAGARGCEDGEKGCWGAGFVFCSFVEYCVFWEVVPEC